MKGEFISIETARINADIKKENKDLQQRIDKARKYINTKIIAWRNEHPEVVMLDYDKIMNYLEGKDE